MSSLAKINIRKLVLGKHFGTVPATDSTIQSNTLSIIAQGNDELFNSELLDILSQSYGVVTLVAVLWDSAWELAKPKQMLSALIRNFKKPWIISFPILNPVRTRRTT